VAAPAPADQSSNSSPGQYYRIEEDWSLAVNQANSAIASPQVSTQMARAPYALHFFNFHVNSIDFPAFQLGGQQLQAWRDTSNVAVYTSPNAAILNTPNELVTWTQYLRVNNGVLKFGISAASSTTWGDFSGMEISVPGAWTYLDDYSADYSATN